MVEHPLVVCKAATDTEPDGRTLASDALQRNSICCQQSPRLTEQEAADRIPLVHRPQAQVLLTCVYVYDVQDC